MGATQKLVPGTNGLPTKVQADTDTAFPLTQPDWSSPSELIGQGPLVLSQPLTILCQEVFTKLHPATTLDLIMVDLQIIAQH